MMSSLMMGPIDLNFHSIYFPIIWKPVGSINRLVAHIPQNILFCVKQKKETRTGLEQIEGEQIIAFWGVCYSFKTT